jgi:hypothetical protein
LEVGEAGGVKRGLLLEFIDDGQKVGKSADRRERGEVGGATASARAGEEHRGVDESEIEALVSEAAGE